MASTDLSLRIKKAFFAEETSEFQKQTNNFQFSDERFLLDFGMYEPACEPSSVFRFKTTSIGFC